MKKHKQRVIISDTIVRNSTDQFPDFIQGKWTQPNGNPVKFEYEYTGWNKNIDWLNKFSSEWAWDAQKWWAIDALKFALITNAASIGTLVMNLFVEKTLTAKVIIPLMESNWFKLGHVLSKVMYATFIEILPAAGVVAALGSLAYIENAVQNGLLQYCDIYANAVKSAKNVVDNTWGWHVDSYDPYIQHRVHKYKSAKITMTAQYGKVILSIVNTVSKPGARNNDTYTVIQNPQELGTKGNLWSGLTNVSKPTITYTLNPEWDHD